MQDRFFDISSPRDMLEKAEREYQRMKADLSTDTVFNFFVTVYHVMDYVKALGSVNDIAVQKMFNDNDFQVCQFLCNKGKHLTLRKGDTDTNTVRSPGAIYGLASYGQAQYGEPPSTKFFVGGNPVDIFPLAECLLSKWENFFQKNGIS